MWQKRFAGRGFLSCVFPDSTPPQRWKAPFIFAAQVGRAIKPLPVSRGQAAIFLSQCLWTAIFKFAVKKQIPLICAVALASTAYAADWKKEIVFRATFDGSFRG